MLQKVPREPLLCDECEGRIQVFEDYFGYVLAFGFLLVAAPYVPFALLMWFLVGRAQTPRKALRLAFVSPLNFLIFGAIALGVLVVINRSGGTLTNFVAFATYMGVLSSSLATHMWRC